MDLLSLVEAPMLLSREVSFWFFYSVTAFIMPKENSIIEINEVAANIPLHSIIKQFVLINMFPLNNDKIQSILSLFFA